MKLENWLPLIFSGLILPVVVGITGAWLNRKMTVRENKRQEKEEQRAKALQKENIIILKSLKSLGHLAEATAIALKDGKVNGEMTTALEYYTKTKDELNNYLYEQNAKANHG